MKICMRRTNYMNEYPSHIEVSDHFYHDSCDLLSRFGSSFDGESVTFHSIKSRRMKCFVDLRMAMESVLKAYASYYCHSNLCGDKLVKKIENYRHHVEKILPKCNDYLPEEERVACKRYCDDLAKLPVGLRYKLDVMDFIDENEEIYYSTIGRDDWLTELKNNIRSIASCIGDALSKESRVISGEEIWKELQRPRYSKYKGKNA